MYLMEKLVPLLAPPPPSLLRLWGVCTSCTSSLPLHITVYRQCTLELHKCKLTLILTSVFCKYSDPAQEAMLMKVLRLKNTPSKYQTLYKVLLPRLASRLCNYKTCRLTGYYDSEVHKIQIHSTDLSCKSSFPK